MMHSNPLLAKYEELYGKKEEPKVIKADELVTVAQLDDAFKNWASSTSIKGTQIGYTYTDEISIPSNLTSSSVATSTTNISITKPPTLKSYDLDDIKASFVAVAERVKNGEAQVSSMSMEMDRMSGTKITFEVYLDT